MAELSRPTVNLSPEQMAIRSLTDAYINGDELGVPAAPVAGFELTISAHNYFSASDRLPVMISARRRFLYDGPYRNILSATVRRLHPTNDHERHTQELWLDFVYLGLHDLRHTPSAKE